MHLKNSRDRYGLVSVTFHWASAVMAAGLFGSGLWMAGLSYADSWYHSAPAMHKAAGLVFVAVVLARLAWKGLQQRPEEIGTPSERMLARAVHGLLYALLATLFLSGYLVATARGHGIDVFGLFTVPAVAAIGRNVSIAGSIHLWAAWTLAALTAVHAAGALKHHFIHRDRVLVRMLGR